MLGRVASQRLYGTHEHLDAPLGHLALAVRGLVPQQGGHVAQDAERDIAASLGPLEALLEAAGVLPLAGRHLGPLDDLVGATAHGGAVHADRALGHARLALVQERPAAVSVVDVNLHAPG